MVGILIYGLLIAVAARAVVAVARREGILAPVLVGFGLRAAVMVAVHVASLLAGDRGTLFVDDITYLQTGTLLADEWRSGQPVDPSSFAYAGTNQFGFHALTGFVFALTGGSVLAVKFVNVLLSSATVLLLGLLAQRWFGSDAKRRAAWIAAVIPGLIWWSVPMLKESLTAFLLVATLLAFTCVSSPRGTARFVALLGALALTRVSAAGAVVIGIGVGLAVAAIRARSALNWRALAAWLVSLGVVAVLGVSLVSRGSPVTFLGQYQTTVESMVDIYLGGGLDLVGLDFFRTFVAPYPWVFTTVTDNWDRGSYPGVWALYMFAPAILLGAWRIKRLPEGLMVLALIGAYTLANAATTGFAFRQRGTIEPLLVLLIVASARSWRDVARLGAAALSLVTLVAVAQSHSALTGMGILTGAAALAALSFRLSPATPRVETPSSLADLVRFLIVPRPLRTGRGVAARLATARRLGPRLPGALGLGAAAWIGEAAGTARRLRVAGPVPAALVLPPRAQLPRAAIAARARAVVATAVSGWGMARAVAPVAAGLSPGLRAVDTWLTALRRAADPLLAAPTGAPTRLPWTAARPAAFPWANVLRAMARGLARGGRVARGLAPVPALSAGKSFRHEVRALGAAREAGPVPTGGTTTLASMVPWAHALRAAAPSAAPLPRGPRLRM